MGRDERYDRFARAVETPMLVLAVVFVVLLVAPLAWPSMPDAAERAIVVGEWAIWVAFATEYVVKLVLAPDRWRFVRTHVPDLVVVAVPMLRPLRLVRSARVLRVLRLGRLAGVAGVTTRRSRRRLHSRVAGYAVTVTTLLVVGCAVGVLELEREHPDANIASLGDALWWAFATVTTVGYGDRFPVTAGGRVVGGVLLVGGIALLGVLTATLASYFVDHVREPDSDDVAARLDRIEQELRRLSGGSP